MLNQEKGNFKMVGKRCGIFTCLVHPCQRFGGLKKNERPNLCFVTGLFHRA